MRMAFANLLTRIPAALAAAARRLRASYHSLDAQVWQIAKTDAPGAPKTPNQPPKIRCC
jgi:hypothetical protein